MSPRTFATAVAFLAVLFVSTVTARQAADRPRMAEDVFKNIQVLKGIPVDEFMATMSVFASATNLNCTDCHTRESGGDWPQYADDTPLKQRARVMVVMMNTLNRTNFGGRQVVTCFTCHRGNQRPTVMSSIDGLYSEPPPDEPGEPFEQAPRQPLPDQVLDAYLKAVGGPQRLAALTSITARGTYRAFDDAETVPVDIVATARGQKSTVVHTTLGDSTTTFDGMNGWLAAPINEKPLPFIPITGQELEGLKFENTLFFPGGIKQALTKWRTGFPSLLDDEPVTLVQGETPGGTVVTLCFNSETALLMRMVRYSDSPVGRVVTRVDIDEYRDVGGVKIPSKWTTSWLSGRSVFALTDVQANVQIPAARFARPAQ